MMSGGDIRENIRVVRRKCPPQTPATNARRCRVLPRVRPPAANVHGGITYTGCGLTPGKTLQRRGLLYENTRHIYGVAVLHKVRPYSGGDCANDNVTIR